MELESSDFTEAKNTIKIEAKRINLGAMMNIIPHEAQLPRYCTDTSTVSTLHFFTSA